MVPAVKIVEAFNLASNEPLLEMHIFATKTVRFFAKLGTICDPVMFSVHRSVVMDGAVEIERRCHSCMNFEGGHLNIWSHGRKWDILPWNEIIL
jgi:hypothetical protein